MPYRPRSHLVPCRPSTMHKIPLSSSTKKSRQQCSSRRQRVGVDAGVETSSIANHRFKSCNNQVAYKAPQRRVEHGRENVKHVWICRGQGFQDILESHCQCYGEYLRDTGELSPLQPAQFGQFETPSHLQTSHVNLNHLPCTLGYPMALNSLPIRTRV